ncbi:MAG: hypothetical protein WDN00_07740 [Limisphaerales bacterium]
MRYTIPLFTLAASIALVPSVTRADIHYTTGINLTTPSNPGGGNSDGTGVWFNPLTGYAETRGFLFPNPLFVDGMYFLVMDARFTQTEAEIFTQGSTSRGTVLFMRATQTLTRRVSAMEPSLDWVQDTSLPVQDSRTLARPLEIGLPVVMAMSA